MPVKNGHSGSGGGGGTGTSGGGGGGGDSEGEGYGSNGDTERSNSSPAHESSDEEEEANEIDSDDSSEMDADEIERRRAECLENLNHLERQFSQLREQYYIERINLIENQFNDVRNGTSEEYLQPLKELDKVYRNRIEVAEVLKRYRLENINHKFASEDLAAYQNFESEKQLTMDNIYEDLIEKIRRLEEDRHNVDISWDDWGTDKRHSKVRGPARKKAVTVTGPYIIYMLHEDEIIEDWTAIRKALKRSSMVNTTASTPSTTGTACGT